jgi:hypothetical protein
MAQFLRSSPRTALFVDADVFARDLFTQVEGLDLVAEALTGGEAPQGQPSAPPPGSAMSVSLETLAPGDAPLLLVRRRDDVPTQRVFAQNGVNYRSQVRQTRSRAHYHRDFELVWDLPEQAQTIEVDEAPAMLRMAPGAAVVLKREGLAAILPQIGDLDLVAIHFPTEEYQFGIPKDHTKSADAFAILGITGGMDEGATVEELSQTFAPEEIVRAPAGGGIRVSRGICAPEPALAPGEAAEIGAYCMGVGIADGVVAQIVLRQVVEGDSADAVLAALAERYGRTRRFHEVRYLERGGRRIVLGWGEALDAGRAQLGRVAAKSPPAVLEAVVWVVDGVTTFQLQLDSVPTVAEAKATQAPAIKF